MRHEATGRPRTGSVEGVDDDDRVPHNLSTVCWLTLTTSWNWYHGGALGFGGGEEGEKAHQQQAAMKRDSARGCSPRR
jgi:hypothetical protein